MYNRQRDLNEFISDNSWENDPSDIALNSEEDGSFFNTDQIECYSTDKVIPPSESTIHGFNQIIKEVDQIYLNWLISEFVLNKYKLCGSLMPAHTSRKVKDLIISTKTEPLITIRNRNGRVSTLFKLNDDFAMTSNKILLSSETTELFNKVMDQLKLTLTTLVNEKNKLKGESVLSLVSNKIRVVSGNFVI